MRFIGTLSISILILLWALSCVEEEDVYIRTISNPVFQREPPTKRDTSVEKDYYDFLNQKLKYFKERRKSDLFVFDFGSNQSPYIEGSIIVTPFNKTIYHRWVNNFGILDFDQNLINPLLTDFLMGVNGNEIVLNIPEGEYELTLVSGSHNSDIRAFLIEVDNVEYRVYNKNFGNFASRKGYYSFNTIDKGIVVKKDGLRIKFKDDWIVNAIIMRLLGNFEIKRYSKLPRYNYRADFYNLLTRDNAIKWSRKFGYNYGLNWDYVVEMSENILRSAGLTNVDNFTKIKYIADYVDKMTRETCCEIPEIDILNSPVDILDPNGFRKGSCFGLARLVGVLANYYGLPARLVGYFIDSDFAEYPSLFPQISSPLFVVKGSYPYY
ncbi:MAG: hypothetical protein N2746_11420, partial [Deltaproteobacteria bacterium]|nr:hypothetical protein [Deltaproteobacteria bacterium]